MNVIENMAEVNFPYILSYKKVPNFFAAIQSAAVPPKFTQKFLIETLEFKGTNDRPLIRILKSLGFIDAAGNPTSLYSDYKNKDIAKNVLGESIKTCYDIL